MHLQSFLLVVLSLSCGSLPAGEVDLTRAVVATLGMIVAWWILCHIAARTTSQQVIAGNIEPIQGAQWLETQLDVFRWLGLGVVVMCLAGFGLARNLDAMPVIQNSMFLQSLVLLFPGLAISAASWSAEHRYGVLLEYADRGIVTHLRSIVSSFRGGVAWLVVPILMLLASADAITRLPISQQQAGWVMAGALVLFLCVGLPWLASRLFKTGPLDGEAEAWVASLLSASGLQRTKAVRWDTEGRSFNALITGFVPPLRTLLLSDRLLDELPRGQLAMVVLHEAAHLRRRHVPLRMLSILPAWGVGAGVTRLAGDASWAMVAGSVVAIILTLGVLRLIAYRTEFDADVQACRLAEKIAPSVSEVPESYAAAAEALSRALIRVTEDHPAARKPTWLHPGVVDRIECIRRQRIIPNVNNVTAGTMANPV
ncbi:Peptidase family M48 [Novipirellula galeiformis]|uniref:Peptidase family M48 n=1 Tax=Novipirellula galeiformis TaxID=2528004 RepID=A0A5C6CRH5_9BACT|nr:M48 family metalloprotease [Novipirellula galeiformis]TWU27072.1 Peptidase family M48 [Novipirellula galeiformis]